jgi:hydroxyacylglutathione hydrolase
LIFVKIIKNYPIDSNCYVVYSDFNQDCVIIDPGTENCEELLSFLNTEKLSPLYVMLTHEHFDHVWGVNKLFESFSFTLLCSKHCVQAIANKKKNLSLFFDNIGFEIKRPKLYFYSSEILINDNNVIRIIETPGHSEGSISILIDNYLFTGDVLLQGSKIITKLPGGNKQLLKQSFLTLNNLCKGKQIIVHPGHGKVFNFDDIDLNTLI